MNKAETLKIMTILSAVYGQGKSDTKAMAEVWHLVLKEYDYVTAEKAVLRFLKEDDREYSTYPTPGRIVQAIVRENSALYGVRNKALHKANYEELTAMQKSWVTRSEYEQLKAMDEKTLLDDFEAIKLKIKKTPLLKG